VFSILIVDDEQWMRETVVRRIGEAQDAWRTMGEAADGAQALEIILRERPDIVLADINMPHKDGIELLRTVREAGLNTLFVFLSGYDCFEYAQSAVNLGAFGYLLKPVDSDEFQDMLHKAWQKLCEYWPKRQIAIESGSKYTMPKSENYYEELIKSVSDYIEDNYAEDINMESVAREYSFHPTYFSRLFSHYAKCNFNRYLTEIRMKKAMEILRESNHSIAEVARLTGYQDAKYFSKVFKRITGETPSNYASSPIKNFKTAGMGM
jgi:YesN/AraC family two-component response regulator